MALDVRDYNVLVSDITTTALLAYPEFSTETDVPSYQYSQSSLVYMLFYVGLVLHPPDHGHPCSLVVRDLMHPGHCPLLGVTRPTRFCD
jgi:hypothetical protein